MAKNVKKVSPVVTETPVVVSWVKLGRDYQNTKAIVASEMKKLADETSTEHARDEFYVGYVAAKLFPALADEEGNAKARGVLANAPHDPAGSPSRDGRVRRTLEEQRAYGAARAAWLEIRRTAGINKASAAGGAHNPNGNKSKADKAEPVTSDAGKADKAEPVKTPEVVKVTETKQAAPIVREFRVRWAAFMTQASKLEDFPIEAGDVAAQITGLMNKLETLLAK